MSKRTSKGQATSEPVSNQMRTMMHVSPSASEVRELIAGRAYELYRNRGAAFGDELSDWLTAEGEVVLMLLAEPQVPAETEALNGRPAGTAGTQQTSKAANGARNRVTRRPKRSTSLNDNPV